MPRSTVNFEYVESKRGDTIVFLDDAGYEGVRFTNALGGQRAYLAKINGIVSFMVFKDEKWADEWFDEKSRESEIEILWESK
jgi:hypothetical protein